MYFSYSKQHAICNAHLIRELRYCEEELGVKWAHRLRRYLEDLNKLVKSTELSDSDKECLEGSYSDLITEATQESPDVDKPMGQRSKEANLLFRMRKYHQEILRFMWDLEVPFTNNQAERDLRMVKVQQKISSQFRTLDGARAYALIRSFISTLKKNSYQVLDGIRLYQQHPKALLNQLFKPLQE